MPPQQFSAPDTGADVDAALGVALTSSAVGMVLLEGSLAEGAPLDHDSFATDPESWASALGIAQQVSDAITRTCAISAAHGYHVRSVGLTWNDDADAAATALLNSLGGTTSSRVVAVRHADAAAVTSQAESVLGERVSVPTEALLALARGAALIAARGGKNLSTASWEHTSRTRTRALAAAATAVVAGAAWSIFAVGLWRSTPNEMVPVSGSLQTESSSVEPAGLSPVPTTIAVVSAEPSPLPVTPPDPSVTLTRVTRVAVPVSVAPTSPHYLPPAVDHLPPSSGSTPLNPGPGN
jgi:hypothetical protein